MYIFFFFSLAVEELPLMSNCGNVDAFSPMRNSTHSAALNSTLWHGSFSKLFHSLSLSLSLCRLVLTVCKVQYVRCFLANNFKCNTTQQGYFSLCAEGGSQRKLYMEFTARAIRQSRRVDCHLLFGLDQLSFSLSPLDICSPFECCQC